LRGTPPTVNNGAAVGAAGVLLTMMLWDDSFATCADGDPGSGDVCGGELKLALEDRLTPISSGNGILAL